MYRIQALSRLPSRRTSLGPTMPTSGCASMKVSSVDRASGGSTVSGLSSNAYRGKASIGGVWGCSWPNPMARKPILLARA